ncbi:GTPase SAR1 family protein [Sphingomonas trueperi]|uniref:hypothetical protein n=1 Tax=Sphingomonas trueperi TaxID=53317 RepID=UPI0033995A63
MDIKTAVELSDAKEAMRQLLAEQVGTEQRNEADTRFHLIDVLIQGLFGWSRDQIRLERAQGRTYTDYELGSPTLAIWEAKAEGRVFSIPVRTRRGMIHEISSIAIASDDAREAIVQVNRYCLDRGADIAVATNGHQLVAFCPREPDLTATIPGKCLVVSSLDDLDRNLDRLWDFLSPEGLRQGILRSFLERMSAPSAPKRLSSIIPNYPQYIQPSALQQSLASMAHLLLINVELQKDIEQQFFEECYCESGALSQHALLSKQMLNARYASLFPAEEASPRVEPVMAKPGKPLLTPEVLSDAISNRPIVLLGDVGVGKSSFLKHLMYVSAYDEFQHALYIYVDLGRTGALSSDLKEVVLDQVESALLEEYNVDIFEAGFVKSVYKQEIKRFDRGIYGSLQVSNPQEYGRHLLEMLAKRQDDRASHVKAAIGFLAKEKRKQIIIALDNSDQRDSETQAEAFIIAQTMASDWRATVFVSMRPRTFYQSKRSGALSAYPHRVFTIAPPRIDAVVRKRLQFALDVAEGRRSLESLSQIRLNLSNVAAFLQVIMHTVDNSDEVNLFLENITGGNIRLLIELIANLMGSPNMDAEAVVRVLEREGNYIIPTHDWWKVAIKGDFRYFDPSRSLSANIFSVFSPDKKEHFLLPLILAYLDASGKHRNSEGFVSYADLTREMQVWGFRATSIESAIRLANNMRLVESNRRVTFDEDEAGLYGTLPDLWRINTVGAYHLRIWCTTFPYLEAIAVDIPLFDEELFDSLAEHYRSGALRDRFERAAAVRDYLTEIWLSSSISAEYFSWEAACAVGESTFARVQRFLDRATA